MQDTPQLPRIPVGAYLEDPRLEPTHMHLTLEAINNTRLESYTRPLLAQYQQEAGHVREFVDLHYERLRGGGWPSLIMMLCRAERRLESATAFIEERVREKKVLRPRLMDE